VAGQRDALLDVLEALVTEADPALLEVLRVQVRHAVAAARVVQQLERETRP